VLLDFRRWQANREVSGHKHYWSGACEQAGSGKTCRHTSSPYVPGHAWQRSPGSTASAKTPPPACSQAAASWPSPKTSASNREQHTKTFPDAAIPSAGSRLPAGRDQPYQHEPRRPRLRRAAAPPRGAAQSGPREPGRAAGPAGTGPRDRPAAQPAGGSLPGTHQERRPGTRDRAGRRSPASTPSPSSSAVPRCCAAALGDVQIDLRRRTAVPDHHRAGRTRLDPDRDQPFVQMNGAACSAAAGWSPQSLTGSPSTRTSSRPAPSPTGCAPDPAPPGMPRDRDDGHDRTSAGPATTRRTRE
jgi:hypothetical protein